MLKTMELPVIWDAMTSIWHHCNELAQEGWWRNVPNERFLLHSIGARKSKAAMVETKMSFMLNV